MSHHNDDDNMRASLCAQLGLTLDYLCIRASLRTLFILSEMLSRHAVEVGGWPPQEAMGTPEQALLRSQQDGDDSWEQELERRRQQAMYQKALAQQVAGQYRQET